jgi:hypothetical protein
MPLLVKSFDPLVRFQSFTDAVLQFQLIFRVQDYDAQFDIWGELQQRLFARLAREGWPPAIPARAIYQYGVRPESPAR